MCCPVGRRVALRAPEDDKPKDLSVRQQMPDVTSQFAERGDLAHLALFLWATSATALAAFAFRELVAASRRFDDFVRELARFNEHFGGH
jgi:hypothetical protein